MKGKRSTVSLSELTREELKELGKKGESYEHIVQRLILEHKQREAKKKS